MAEKQDLLYNREIQQISMTTNPTPSTPSSAEQSDHEIYNEIMRGIDPELTSDQIHSLDEKYKDESKEDRVKRVERYNNAFAAFDVIAAERKRHLQKERDAHRKKAMASAEAESRTEETQKLQQMEAQFS